MAASRIKGITIEIGGDTTKLVSALSKVDAQIKNTQTNLRDINKALKLDPTSTSLLTAKQTELAKQVDATKSRIETEKQALEELNKKLDEPWDLDHAAEFQANAKAAEDLKLQIELDTAALKDLEKQAQASSSVFGMQMQAWGDKLKEVGDKIKSVGDNIAQMGSNLTQKVTVPIVAAGTVAVSKFAEVDKTMTLTNQTMGNTAEQAELLDKAMKEAAANSTFGMNEAAQASLNFARAGLSAEQAANSLAPAMNLAAGEAGDLNTVSSGLVATINGFGDSFEEAERYADVFAAACNNSALDVDGLSQAMSVAAPIFKTAGKEVEDAALYMGVMANAGIDANVAANSLKTGMARLAEPTKQAQKAMEEYGIAMGDIWNEDGSMKDLVTVQANLNKAFSDLSEQEQMAAAGAIFGKNQMSSWLALINTAPSEVDKLSQSLESASGTTTEMADAMMGGFGGSIEKLKSSLDVLMTSLGGLIAQYLTPVIEKIQGLVDAFMGLDEETQNHIVKIAMIVAAMGPVLLVVGKVVSGIGSLVSTIGSLSSMIGSLLPVLAGISAPVLAVVAAIGVLTAAFIHLYNSNEDFRNKINETFSSLQEKFSEIQERLQPAIDAIIEAFQGLLEACEPIIEFLIDLINGIVEGVINALDPITKAIEAAIDYVTEIIEAVIALFKGDFSGFFEHLKNALSSLIDFWKNAISAVISFIDGLLKSFGIDIGSIFNSIKTTIQNIWTNIKTTVTNLVSGIVNTVVTTFSNMKNGISNTCSNIKSVVVNGFSGAINYIKSLPSQALGWGKDIIGNLIDGIKSKISAVKDAVKGVADTIASYIHFSLPDEGPLKDADEFMPDFMNLLTKGIYAGIPKLESAMNSMASSMVPSLQATPSGNVDNSTNSVVLNVYGAPGQDINELADVIEQKITNSVIRRGVAFS